MFRSGEWTGYWTQQMGRRVHKGQMCPLVLLFTADGVVEGRGTDEVGEFTFKGKFNDLGEVEMRKRYAGAHTVRYKGLADGGGGISGRWTIGGYLTGDFVLTPVESAPAAGAVESAAAAEPPLKRRAKSRAVESVPPPARPEPPSASPLRRRKSPPPA